MPRRRDRLRLDYRIAFSAPFHCGTGLPSGLVNRTVGRDAEGFLIVPGSTFKGAVRERCERLARLFGLDAPSPHDPRNLAELGSIGSPIPALFGSRRQVGGLFFDDARLSAEARKFFDPSALSLRPVYQRWQVQERTQVSLSRVTRTARPGALFTSEYGVHGLEFEGAIGGLVEDWGVPDGAQAVSHAIVLLVAGVLAVDGLGGNRSTGAGACSISISSLRVNGERKEPEDVLKNLGDLEYYTLAEES
jgi:CRISPR/Cas system CSM-associated protein Csm3 (group 7 of RAMP superfamily)